MSSATGSRLWRSLATSLGALGAVAAIILSARVVEDRFDYETTIPAPQLSPGERVGAATARIAKESLGEIPSPEARGRPSLNESPGIGATSVVDPLKPPPGYALVDHFGDMTRARVETNRIDRGVVGGDRPEWLNSDDAVATLVRQAAEAGREWSFGWIRLGADATRGELGRALEGTGVEIVGASGRMIRARLPGDSARLAEIVALDAVDGIGARPRVAKLAAFADDPVSDANGQVPVYVTLMADDRDGRWAAAMEDLGATVGGYDARLRVYRANARDDVIEALAAADYVAAVEPIRLVQAMHDTAVPVMGADALRTWDGAPGVFSGSVGASVPIAVMDTGLNVNHVDISSHRDSICGANFAYNSGWFGDDGPLVEDEELWIDSDGHGTHVTGTVVGNGYAERRFAGMAPGVRHIRFAKVLDAYGAGFGDSVERGMEFLATPSGCSEAGRMSARVKPLVVNLSLSAAARIFEGRDVGARKLDAMVWGHRQLYVVSQANAGIHGFSDYGAAKNSLAVGAAMDDGAIAPFSSHGPTADGRLAPNVVGAGVQVHSAQGDGSRGAYVAFSGTSMASPAVAGVAALLMDVVPAHKEQPALTRARLMASAIRPDPWLGTEAGFPTDNTSGPGPIQARFGMGKASARTAALNRDSPSGWRSGSATTELEDGEYAWRDIEVPAGATRLDLVMTWDEPPAGAVAGTVLNDLDLWLDRDGDCATAACGEHVSRSRIDNVEWIIVRNPEPGTYRAKVLAHRVYTEAPRAALAWTVIRGSSTPTLAITSNRTRLERGREHELTLTLTADAYVAAGARLHVDCRGTVETRCNDLVTIQAMSVSREDGVSFDPAEETESPVPLGYTWNDRAINLGGSIPVGEVAVGAARTVTVRVSVTGDEDGAARLHFTASAWNARAGSVTVAVGSADAPEVVGAANDDFADAAVIEGEEGSAPVDLLAATAEPGEPVFDERRGRPASSVWFSWTAPADGPFRFAVPPLAADYGDHDGVARHDRVQVLQGKRLAALREVAAGLWQATFFAAKGEIYWVRVAGSSRGAVLDLDWSPGARPANDDFADAIVIDGGSGDVAGTTAGATLEPGESFGPLAATTWFLWRAPSDGRYQFSVGGNRSVLVFEGSDIAALRLVGGWPGNTVHAEAGAGREYRIAVAEPDARGLGGEYSLNWIRSSVDAGNDAFANALAIGDDSPEQAVEVDATSTVEPGEPPATGVRTKWWSWVAPEDGLYTWRVESQGAFVPKYPKIRITMFAGTAFVDLRLVAETGPGGPFGFLLDATGGERYWVAAGLGHGDWAGYEAGFVSAKLIWGRTPDNDEAHAAATITGASGSVAGSNRFATGSRGERGDLLGRSTLWWNYEAPATGWIRFAVDGDGGPWALTVHRDGGDGLGGMDVVGTSHWQRSDREVLFWATKGTRYRIALGARRSGRGGDFTLYWEEAEDPGWLRYLGRLADGERDSRGNPVEIRGLRELAMHADGSALYAGSRLGLQVFERDLATGRLDYAQLVDVPFDPDWGVLLWDERRDRLLTDDCGTLRGFETVAGGTRLGEQGDLLAEAYDAGSCASAPQLLMDAGGSSLYRVGDNRIEHYAAEGGGALRLMEAVDVGDNVVRAVLSNGGREIYAVTPSRLLVFERDAESGGLARTAFEGEISAPASGPVPLAITDDDAWLFVFDNNGEHANVFSLEDPLQPEMLATLPDFWGAPPWSNRCHFADVRRDAAIVDTFCRELVFTARWDPEAAELSGSDFLSEVEAADRFNSLAMPVFRTPTALAVSPDDRYAYLGTANHGILTFGRGAAIDDDMAQPDLVVDPPTVDNAEPAPGTDVTLVATVRNQGDEESPATTLRFYRSVDASIDGDDTEVGSAAVTGIAPSGTSDHSIGLTVPSEPGTYRYGACIDSVAGESSTSNNCSDAVEVMVGVRGGGADSYCRDGDVVPTGAECEFYDTSVTFDVSAHGRGCVRARGINLCNGNSMSYRDTTLNGERITFVADRNDDDSWTIEDVEPEP